MKSSMYIMALELISLAYFLNPSHQSVYLYVYPPYRCLATARYTRSRGNEYAKQKRIVGSDSVLSEESLWISLCIRLSLEGIGSLNTSPQQRRIVAGIFFFYAICVVSKESTRLVFPRTFSLNMYNTNKFSNRRHRA
jgi:hypothetical protein